MSDTASSAAAGARDAATPVGQQVAHAAHEEDSAAVTAGAEGCADARGEYGGLMYRTISY